MLVMKYEKRGAAAFLSHLDTLRHLNRTIRRAGIPVAYSEGFNPHMQLHMSPPLPLGIESGAEYCTVGTELAPEEYLSRYNAAANPGMRALAAYPVQKDPNIAGNSYSAHYRIRLPGLGACCNQVLEILNGDRFDIEYYAKGGQTVTDVRAMILDLSFEGEVLLAVLRAGNVNLRADRFAYNLARIFDLPSEELTVEKVRHDIGREGEGGKDIDAILK